MSISPGRLNWTLQSGATFRNSLTVYEAVDTKVTTISGLTLLNLAGFTGTCTLRIAPHEGPPLYTMTTDNGGLIIDPTNSFLQMHIPAQQTLEFTFPSAVYDLFLTDNDGNYFTPGDTIPLLRGNIRIKGNSP